MDKNSRAMPILAPELAAWSRFDETVSAEIYG
jgi:hypothetical protein